MKSRISLLFMSALVVMSLHAMQPAADWLVTQQEEIGTGIKLVSRKGNVGPKVVGIIIAPKNKSFLFETASDKEFRAMQKVVEAYASALLQSPSTIAARAIAPTAQAASPVLELITLQTADSSDIKRMIDSLYRINKNQEYIPVIVFAWGEQAHLVNQATQTIPQNRAIDTLIYLQSPIYESEPKSKPLNFRKLFHFYGKGSAPTLNVLRYPDRKYRQQARVEGSSLLMPVKNCLMIKKNDVGSFKDFTIEDFFDVRFLGQLPQLITKCDAFKVNFDLVAFDTLVLINRFVYLDRDNSFKIVYGDKKDQVYTIYPLPGMPILNAAGYDAIVRQMMREVFSNKEQLRNVNIQQTDSHIALYNDLQKRQDAAEKSDWFKEVKKS